MKKIRNNYDDIYPAGPTYIRGVRTGDTLYISGTTASRSEAEGKDVMSQLRVVLDRIVKIVQAEGGSASDIVSMTTFIVDTKMSQFWPIEGEQLEIWNEFFGGEWPTNAYIGISCLAAPTVDVEISAIAVLD